MSVPRRVVVLSADPVLCSAVGRLGALAGAAVETCDGADARRAGWRAAELVIVGADLAAALPALQLPRRAGVALVSAGPADESVWRAAVGLGAEAVVELPAQEGALVDLIADAVDDTARVGTTIAVVAGCGGAGASTLAAAVAVAAGRLGPAILIDADPYAGGLDLLLGVEHRPGPRWADLAGVRGRLPTAALTERLPALERVAVLSWGREAGPELGPEAAAAVVDAARRGFDWVVTDLPGRLDPAAAVLAAHADLAVLVVPTMVRAAAAAAVVAGRLQAVGPKPRLAVRAVPSGQLSVRDVETALRLPVVATVRTESAIAIAAERGEHPLRRDRGALAEACHAVLSAAASVGGPQ